MPLGQESKDIERTGPDRDGLGDSGPVQPGQTAAGAIEAKSFELENSVGVSPSISWSSRILLWAQRARFRPIFRPPV